MAFGGGGFAINRALATRLARMQDGCMHRYPVLYGSDDRIHAYMSELGVPLNQCDIWGDVLGLLGSHPVVPLVTLHHFDFLPDGGAVKAIRGARAAGPSGRGSAVRVL
jgi:hypothetical protein